MDPDESAGTPGEVLGGKEKIEIPHSGEFEPGSFPRPGLTFEAHRGVKSPLGEAGDERSPKPLGEHSSVVPPARRPTARAHPSSARAFRMGPPQGAAAWPAAGSPRAQRQLVALWSTA